MEKNTGKMVTSLHGAETAAWSQSRSNQDNVGGRTQVSLALKWLLQRKNLSAQQWSWLLVLKETRGCGRASVLLWNHVCLTDKLLGTLNTGEPRDVQSALFGCLSGLALAGYTWRSSLQSPEIGCVLLVMWSAVALLSGQCWILSDPLSSEGCSGFCGTTRQLKSSMNEQNNLTSLRTPAKPLQWFCISLHRAAHSRRSDDTCSV